METSGWLQRVCHFLCIYFIIKFLICLSWSFYLAISCFAIKKFYSYTNNFSVGWQKSMIIKLIPDLQRKYFSAIFIEISNRRAEQIGSQKDH